MNNYPVTPTRSSSEKLYRKKKITTENLPIEINVPQEPTFIENLLGYINKYKLLIVALVIFSIIAYYLYSRYKHKQRLIEEAKIKEAQAEIEAQAQAEIDEQVQAHINAQNEAYAQSRMPVAPMIYNEQFADGRPLKPMPLNQDEDDRRIEGLNLEAKGLNIAELRNVRFQEPADVKVYSSVDVEHNEQEEPSNEQEELSNEHEEQQNEEQSNEYEGQNLDELINEQNLDELIDERSSILTIEKVQYPNCEYIFARGKNNGKTCGLEAHHQIDDQHLCSKHNYQLHNRK